MAAWGGAPCYAASSSSYLVSIISRRSTHRPQDPDNSHSPAHSYLDNGARLATHYRAESHRDKDPALLCSHQWSLSPYRCGNKDGIEYSACVSHLQERQNWLWHKDNNEGRAGNRNSEFPLSRGQSHSTHRQPNLTVTPTRERLCTSGPMHTLAVPGSPINEHPQLPITTDQLQPAPCLTWER